MMKKSFCELVLDYFPRISQVENLYATAITNCVFNSFLSYTAIVLNIVTIHAIRKTPSLPKTLKTTLLSLAVSDVGVGLLVQPFYISVLFKWLQKKITNCGTYKTFIITGNLFATASFLGVVAISVDRFLAIHLHLRYQELVTHKRVVAVVISIWVLSVFVSFSTFWVPLDIYTLITAFLAAVGLVLTTKIHLRIYFAIKQHKKQIQVRQVQQVAHAGEIVILSRLTKSAVGIFYVYLVFLVCYLPYLICLVAPKMNVPSIVLKRFSLFSFTLLYLNSSLNPVIYCWKMRHIRHAVINILRNMSWQKSGASRETITLAGHKMRWLSVGVDIKRFL